MTRKSEIELSPEETLERAAATSAVEQASRTTRYCELVVKCSLSPEEQAEFLQLAKVCNKKLGDIAKDRQALEQVEALRKEASGFKQAEASWREARAEWEGAQAKVKEAEEEARLAHQRYLGAQHKMDLCDGANIELAKLKVL